MEIRIIFETSNAAFQDYPHGDGNFDEEVKHVLRQAEEFVLGGFGDDNLKDTNGNSVGRVWTSTTNRRG